MDDLNQGAFVDKIRQGDSLAFQILFDRLVPKLCNFIVATFGVARQDAEEIASDAMLKVHKSVARFDSKGGAKLTTWIFEIARKTAIDHRRKQIAQKKKAEGVTADDLRHEPAVKAESKAAPEDAYEMVLKEEQIAEPVDVYPQLTRMRLAFDSLSEQDRDILRMRRVMDYNEIARIENISANAARVRHFRAEDRLHTAFEKGGEDE